MTSHCISYRYDDESTNRSKDDWESEDGVMVFSPEADAMGFYSEDVDDLKMQILTFNIYLTQASPGA